MRVACAFLKCAYWVKVRLLETYNRKTNKMSIKKRRREKIFKALGKGVTIALLGAVNWWLCGLMLDWLGVENMVKLASLSAFLAFWMKTNKK